MIYLALLGALALSLLVLFEKIGVKKIKIDSNHFFVGVFLCAVLLMIPFLPFLGGVKTEFFALNNILIFFGVIVFAVFSNICYFYALTWEKISNLEPVHLMEPLFTVVLASILFTSERNPNFIIPAVISAGALLFSHIRKHHLDFNKYIVIGILGSLFYSIETMFTKVILEFFTPLSLYFFRSVSVLIVGAIVFRPKPTKEIKGKRWWLIALVGGLWVVYRVLAYYGFIKLGVVFTTLILMVSPVLIYFFAWKFLKEKLDWRNVAAGLIIVASILYALFL